MAITSLVCLLAAYGQLVEELIEHGNHAVILKLTHATPGEHDNIESYKFGLAMPEGFPTKPLDAIAVYCVSNILFGNHQTHAAINEIRWNGQQHGVARAGLEAGGFKDLAELFRG
jgi:hypothetical protein